MFVIKKHETSTQWYAKHTRSHVPPRICLPLQSVLNLEGASLVMHPLLTLGVVRYGHSHDRAGRGAQVTSEQMSGLVKHLT